jgi:uncharacterized repeat protein (TIGR01451 family)
LLLRNVVIAAALFAAWPAALFATNVDLSIPSVSGSPNPITLNTGNITYSVQVFNASGTSGTNTMLTNTLPVNSTYVSSSTTGGGSCSPSAGIVTCNWTSIPASTNFFATIVVTPTAGGSLTLSSSVSGTEPDPNSANNNASGSVTVNSQIDLQIIGVTGTPNPMTLGTGNISYSVQVFNASTSQGTGTVLTATLPASSTFVSATTTGGGSCSQSAGTVTCNWTSIPASTNYFATIVVTPTVGGTATLATSVAGTEPDPNTANNNVNGSVTVNSQIDLRIIAVTGTPNPMTLGTGNISYSVQVFNASTSQGTGTVLTAGMPASSTFVSATTTGGGSCSQSAGIVTCNWTSIPASTNYFATIVVTPTVGGTATLATSVAGTEPDPNTANNNVNGLVTVNSQIDLRIIGVTGTPNPMTLNTGNISYSVQVFNASTSQGTGTVLTAGMPASSTFVSATTTGGGSCSQSAGIVTCNWTSIPASNNYFATIVVTPTVGGTATLAASVSGSEPDPNTADNNVNGLVTVNSQIDLRIIGVTGSPNPMTLGTGNATYSVQVFNASTSQGTGTVLTATLPASSTFVSATTTGGGSCSQSAGTVTCNWTSIPASNNYFATIVVTPTVGGTATLAVNVAGTEPDPNTADNNVSGSVTVNSQIDLRIIAVTGSPSAMTLGTGNATYTVQVFNASTSQGTGTVLTAPLPASSTFVSATATGGGICSQSAGTVTCNWTSIPASNNFFATIVVTPTVGGTATLAASVSGAQPDPNTADNNVSGSVTVNSQIDLQIIGISGTPDPITFAAGNVTYLIQVFNASTSQGTNTILTSTLPSNSNYVSSSATGSGVCNQSSGTVTCNWTSIPASNNFFTTIVVTPTIPGNLTLSTNVAGTQPDPNTANNAGSKTTTVTPTTCTVAPSGMLTWYRAEGNGIDAAGPNNLTANGGVSYTTGEVSQGFSLNGTSGELVAADNATFQQTTLTIEGWFFLTGGTGVRTIVSKAAGSALEDSFVVYIAADGSLAAGTGNDSLTEIVTTSAFPTTNAWHHFAFLFDGSVAQLYLDGGTVGSTVTSQTILYDSNPMVIGADIDNGSPAGFFPGRIDELTFYNRLLTMAEVQSIYGAGTFGKCYIAPSTPTITGFTPTSDYNNGAAVVITGTNFIGVSAVKFNGVSATFTGDSTSQITAFVPAGATTGTISVTAGGGTATSAGTFTVLTQAHWINSSGGNWSTASNWSTGSVPGATTDAIIDANGTYAVNLDVDASVLSLSVGGTVSGTQTLSLNASHDLTIANASTIGSLGMLTMSSGRLLGAGVLTIYGIMNWNADSEIQSTVTVATGALNISGNGTRFLNGGTLNNNGVVNWSGANNISVYNSGVINNLATGGFSITNDQLIYQHCCTPGQAFTNDGYVLKTVATGTTTIQSNGFNNTGSVDIQSGTFSPSSGGASTGTFNAGPSGSFLFSNATYTLGSGALLTGSGNYQVSSGQLMVNATGVTVDHLTLTGGTLNIPGLVSTSATGVIDWTADATLTGAGSLTIGSGGTLNIAGNGTRFIDGGKINNSGTVNWSGLNNISVFDSGVINNLAGGLFSVKNDQLIYQHCCTAGLAFNNAGTFRKTVATGTTQIQSNGFNNTGTVDIQSGTFNPSSGGTSSSIFNATSNGTFLFNNNTYTLASGATLTGSGNFQLSNVGQLAINATGVTADHLTLTGGTLNIAGALSTSASGVIDWTADATLTGAGALTIASGGTMNIIGNGTRRIDGGTINNSGTINWSGLNNISIYDSGVINNQSGGLFSVKNDQLIYQHCCTAGQAFNNVGTFRKTVATGTTTIQSNGFTNSGTVDIQSGIFNPTSGGTSTGIFNATSTGTFLFSTNTYTLSSGATLTGSGNFQVSSVGQLAVNASGVTVDHLILTGGTLNIGGSIGTSATGVIDWGSDATLTGAGSLTIASGGTLNLPGFGTRFIDGGTINNSGTVNWSGANNISLFNSGVINNQAGGLFNVTNDQLVYFHCCSAGQPFNNAGTFRKTTAIGATNFNGIGFANSGTIDTDSGTIAFNASYSSSGTPVYQFGIGSTSTYGRLSFANFVNLTGALIAAPVNSFVPQGGQQFQIISFPSGSATFAPKTLTYGSSPTRSFADSYGGTGVTLTASGPTITAALSPNQGDLAGGTAVTITGGGFVNGSLGVTFGGNAATSVAFVNASTITCVTPAHSAGLVDVVLTNGDGQPTTATNAFTYGNFTADVGITSSASPTSVANGGAFTLTTVVTNNGPTSSSNTTATIALPANVTLAGPPSSTQGTCSGTTTITCSIGTLAMGNSATQTINLTANSTGTAMLSAGVSATEPDPVSGNNSSVTNVIIAGSSLLVTTNADSGTGSLRQAILDANNVSICTVPCTIGFNLPAGQLTISPPTSLPAITSANVTIDATTQPGFSGTPLITLNGTSNPNPSAGLQLSGGNDTVKGLSIVSFQGAAILIDTAGNDVIAGNYLGIHTNGTTAGQNAGDGIHASSGSNTIGGTTAAARNVISGNFLSGIVLTSNASNLVQGNYIGLNAAGTTAVANHQDGIQLLSGATNNTIGGLTPAERNVIAGNSASGIYILGSSGNLCTGNVISGNYIGTDATGSSTVGNSVGVFLGQFAANNTIGGVSAAAANTIDFTTGGVFLLGSGNGNTILHNAIRDNAGMPIDLEMNGPTPNDAGDSDTGANGLQNFPLFLDASLAGSTLTTRFNVDSASVPSTASIRVELFRSDPSHVQLLKWIGSQCFAGNALSGAAMTIPGSPLVIGDNLAGTATSYSDASCTTPNDGTSEVSNVIAVAACTPPPATITPSGPTTFCAGGSVTLIATASASYQWRNFGTPIVGANAQQLVVTTGGSYTVTVTNAAGCSGTSAATSVTVNSTVNVTISGPTSFCAGGNATLTANPSGGSGSFTSYQWSLNGTPVGGATASTYNATAGGSYTVTATDSNGCTGASSPATITVNPLPSASINAPASACANSTVAASISAPVAGATYTWSVTNGTLQSGQGTSSITFTVTTATPVSLSVVASSNGCTANGNASITVGAFVPTITSSATSFCPGGSVTLTSSSGASYQWLINGSPIGGANAQTYVASVAGDYSVSVTTGAGCSGSSATTTITQAAVPSPTITTSGPATFCSGGTVTLTSSAASSYQWLLNGSPLSGATNSSFVAATSGSYSVTVTNGAGCSGTSSTVNVTAVQPPAVIAPSTVAPNSTGNTASVSPGPAGSTYIWTISGGTITSGNGTPSITWTAGASGSAAISVSQTTGSCTTSGSATIAIANSASADLAMTVSATPNPVNAGDTVTFTINISNSGPDVAQDVRVANTLFGVTAPVASGNGWTCITSGLTIGCNLTSLGIGPAAPLTITATAAAGNSAGDNAAVVSATSDPNGNNNNTGASVTVNTQPSCSNIAPSAIAPPAGASNVANPVNFSWSAAPNATAYDLWIASSGATPALVTTTQSTSASINLPAGTSTWYVTAHFAVTCPTLSSPPRDFTVAPSTNCTHPAPQLIGPSQNAVVNAPVTFSWTPVSQAVGYRLWIALDGSATQDAGTTNGATSLTVSLTASSVSWHVDAIFPGCNPTSSPTSSFTIATNDPCAGHTAPALLTPSPNGTLASSVIDFHWTAVAGANGYRVWTSINGAALAPVGTTSSATTLHTTITSGAVVWYVEALFNGCASVPSSQQSFTIPPATNCNNPAATPQSPANDATSTSGATDFAWAPAANAIGYELWLSFNNGAPALAGTTTATTLRRTIGPGNIEWFVRALFNGCDPVESAHLRFTYTPPADCSLIRPILTAPAEGAQSVISPFDLRWSNVPGATLYKVWLGTGDAAPVVIGTTPSTHLDNQDAPEGPVTWFVEALFDSCPSLNSTSSTFTAAHPLPPCAPPDVPLPRAEGTASTNVEYVIRWTPSGPTGTTQYELQESDDASFTSPASTTTSASELAFKHVNGGDTPITYYYRVRAISTCTGARTLFSPALAVQVLPSNVTDPASANGSTPADNPQTTHYQIHIGGGANGSAHKGAIAAAAGDTFTASTNQPWLSVSPSSGTVAPDGTTLTVTAKTDGLPIGTSSGAVNIAFGSASSSSHGNLAALGTTPPSSSTTVSVNLVQPVSPTAKTAPPPDALIIPAVAHADGINSKFQSDVRVTNSSAQPMKYQITFQPTGDTGIADGKQTTVDIDPGHTLALDDVLQSWFGSNGATGTLEVRPLNVTTTSTNTAAATTGLPNILTFAASRTFNTTANGTFGQYIPAIPFAAFVGRGTDITKTTILSLQQIAQSPAYRTNLGIVEGSGDPASVLISVFGDNGQKLTEFTQDLKGGQHVQLNSILAQKNVQVSDGRIEVKVITPGGKVTAYASVIDNLTNDPLLVSPVAVNQAAAARYVLPGVADLNNGVANWQTDVRLFNPSTNIVKATMTFFSQNGTSQSKDVSLAPGQVQTFDGALQQLFGISNDGGALHVFTPATTPLVATARTYNQTANGTYGQFIPAVTANDAAALGSRPLQLLQIEESDRYRTNVGFAEVTGKAARIEVTAVPTDSKVAASTQIDIAPNQFVQYPQLLKSMGLTNMYNARVTVKVISGQGKVTAYASVIDMQTNDPTFVPAQ